MLCCQVQNRMQTSLFTSYRDKRPSNWRRPVFGALGLDKKAPSPRRLNLRPFETEFLIRDPLVDIKMWRDPCWLEGVPLKFIAIRVPHRNGTVKDVNETGSDWGHPQYTCTKSWGGLDLKEANTSESLRHPAMLPKAERFTELFC